MPKRCDRGLVDMRKGNGGLFSALVCPHFLWTNKPQHAGSPRQITMRMDCLKIKQNSRMHREITHVFDGGKFFLSREARQPTRFLFCRCRWDRRTGTRLWVGSDRWGWRTRCGLFLRSLLTRPCLRWQRFPKDHQPPRPLRRKLARVESVHSSGQTTPQFSRWRTRRGHGLRSCHLS